jgi:hypothetical protein
MDELEDKVTKLSREFDQRLQKMESDIDQIKQKIEQLEVQLRNVGQERVS